MWPFSPERDTTKLDGNRGDPPARMTLSRFRRNTLFYQRYWTKFFSVTRPDLMRLNTLIRERNEALPLTSLVREVIRSRLRSGPQLTGEASIRVRADTPSVRFWHPAEVWRAGDHAIFAIPDKTQQAAYVPRVGTVLRVGSEGVTASIDGLSRPRTYRTGESVDRSKGWISRKDLDALFKSEDEAQQIDYVVWNYGDTITEQVFAALSADERFLHLQAHWYLRTLSPLLDDAQVIQLARELFAHTAKPVPFSTLTSLVSPPLAAGPGWRFGLFRTVMAHPAFFRKLDRKPEPLWTLAGPPPGRWIARHAAYDPETFKILCAPWEVISPEAAQRLWVCGLFRAVVTGEPDSEPEH